jgi:hypothetical protein
MGATPANPFEVENLCSMMTIREDDYFPVSKLNMRNRSLHEYDTKNAN